MKVKVTPLYNTPLENMWRQVRKNARNTVSKQDVNSKVSDAFKTTMLNTEHSPIRALWFDIELMGIPTDVSQQISRHIIAMNDDGHDIREQIYPTDSEDYVSTRRPDRGVFNREDINRTTLVDHYINANFQGLIDMSKKRLCIKAQKETVQVWRLLKEQMKQIDPMFSDRMVKSCIYRGGICGEQCAFKGSNAFNRQVNEYKKLING